MEIIRNKPRSNRQSRYWALIPLASSIWFFYWSLAGKESDFLRYMWFGIGFLIFAFIRWFFPLPVEGINRVTLGEAVLTIEYFGDSVLKIHRDLIHSVKSFKKNVLICYYRNEELCTCILPKKFFDKDSWERMQQLENML